MTHPKRSRDDSDDGQYATSERSAVMATTSLLECDPRPAKRTKTREAGVKQRGQHTPSSPFVAFPSPTSDYLSPLSDELLIRILGHLSVSGLLAVAPVSRRFHRLADDSQLWKALYYARFVLPRAMRIPGFRSGSLTGSASTSTGALGGDWDAKQISQYWQRHVPPGAGGASVAGHPDSNQRQQRHADGAKGRTKPDDAWKTANRDRNHNQPVDWKRQYRLRHNWARGTCAVEELRLGGSGRRNRGGLDEAAGYSQDEDDADGVRGRMVVKVLDGIAVTADPRHGLRVWELKTRSMLAGASLNERRPSASGRRRVARPGAVATPREERADAVIQEEDAENENENDKREDDHEESDYDEDNHALAIPSSLAVDGAEKGLDIAVGLANGGFDVWHLGLASKTLVRRFAHPASSSGAITGIAYAHPYVLTATDTVLVSLYVFPAGAQQQQQQQPPPQKHVAPGLETGDDGHCTSYALRPPVLLTSLRSHTSRPPLALSIRKLASVTVASIAYTFSTRQGWSIGIQDLHVKPAAATTTDGPRNGTDPGSSHSGLGLPHVVTSRLAYSSPVSSSGSSRRPSMQAQARAAAAADRFRSRHDDRRPRREPYDGARRDDVPYQDAATTTADQDGPTSLCYTHPYLLATMPDNTLILYLCTSTASMLALSAGIRLWGHTSGISDAEITARGKAVSVSMRGEEMRVWELEGRPAAERGRSVAIRPSAGEAEAEAEAEAVYGNGNGHGHDNGDGDGDHRNDRADRDDAPTTYDWDERRNWVGFDEEMVIVLKEARGGRESLLVYDFT
ncbi:f-box domain containing protein [Niveomyces insectorum RCEF 264]|uniref:F-box domain containing protein n=1 Tax=Niveomyces insectorum RCEF 264 TaxID=1081102 RepID=A0A167UTF4_9HYPO|nr:f-box domain containing protein [Niveomyces insectorum RCEF 264]